MLVCPWLKNSVIIPAIRKNNIPIIEGIILMSPFFVLKIGDSIPSVINKIE